MKRATITKYNECKINFNEFTEDMYGLPLHANFWMVEFLENEADKNNFISSKLFHTKQLFSYIFEKPIHCFFMINPLCHEKK
jgi:hypothetical protein